MDTDYGLTRTIKQIAEAQEEACRSCTKQLTSIFAINDYLSQQFSAVNLTNFHVEIPDIYIDLTKFSAGQLAEIANLAGQISLLASESAFDQIRELTSGLDIITKRVAADIATFRIISAQLSYHFSALFAPITETKEVVDAFKAANWPIAPSMPEKLKSRIVYFYNTGKIRYASNAIIGYYRRNEFINLSDAVNKWATNPLFATKMHIFLPALRAHKQGDYVLSVPTLLPQVEGILNEYVIKKKLPAKAGKIGKVYEAVLQNVSADRLATWAIVQTLLYMFQNNIYVFTKFEDELQKATSSRKLSRHTVLHGVSPNYNRPGYSLKIFMLLDALSILRV